MLIYNYICNHWIFFWTNIDGSFTWFLIMLLWKGIIKICYFSSLSYHSRLTLKKLKMHISLFGRLTIIDIFENCMFRTFIPIGTWKMLWFFCSFEKPMKFKFVGSSAVFLYEQIIPVILTLLLLVDINVWN